MKKSHFTVIIIITAICLSSCLVKRDQIPQTQSTFKEGFSIGPIVETNKGYLLDGPLPLSGMQAGPIEPFIQSQEEMIVQIDPMVATDFMKIIKSDVEESINASGANIVGKGGGVLVDSSDILFFSFSYTQDSFYGVINIWGVRGDADKLLIIAQITESPS
jgi:hypothetical protein